MRCERSTSIPINRGNIACCQQNGACRLFLSDLYWSERESGSRCWVAGRSANWVSCSWHCLRVQLGVCVQTKPPIQQSLWRPRHKAVCNMSEFNSGLIQKQDKTEQRGRRAEESADSCDSYESDIGSLCNLMKRRMRNFEKERGGGEVRDSR